MEFFLRSPLNRARLKQVSLYIKQPEQVRTIAMRSERYGSQGMKERYRAILVTFFEVVVEVVAWLVA